MHVMPAVTTASLASTGKYADADYGTLFLKDIMEVFDLRNTKITVSKAAVLQGVRCKGGLYRIPLKLADSKVLDPPPQLIDVPQAEHNKGTILVCMPPLPKPKETIHNAYELRM